MDGVGVDKMENGIWWNLEGMIDIGFFRVSLVSRPFLVDWCYHYLDQLVP